jgi:UDP-glucose 4-epimerase
MMGGGMAEACDRVRRGVAPVIDEDGTQVQDFVYVGDVARANILAMESDVSGEAFNIVGGQETSQNRIMEIIREAAGSDIQQEYRPYTGGAKLAANTRYVFSREKAKRLLDWEPQVTIEEGVRRVLRWVDQQRALSS